MRMLWVGDAVTQTGFQRVTDNVIRRLLPRGWEVAVLGINANGDPPPLGQEELPYRVYPAMLGGDPYGLGRIKDMITEMKPDVVVINNDPWVVADFFTKIPRGTCVVAYMPVDAPNQEAANRLNNLSRAIAYTHFGRKELMAGGMTVQCDVIPHGVDTKVYHPGDRKVSRDRIKWRREVDPEKAFIVMNVNRNQPRKRLDLTIQYWTQWWVNAGQPIDAFLHLHCSNQEIEGWDVVKLARYYGIEHNLIITDPRMTPRLCMKENDLFNLYCEADVMISTTQGEGWGLTQHEAMACGVPQIVPKYSALAEWARDAVHFVDVTGYAATPNTINTIGGIADKEQFVAAIDKFYREPEYRQQMADAAYARATESRFTWDSVAEQFHMVLLDTIASRKQTPVGVEAPKS